MHRFLFSIWLLLCFCQLQAQQLTPHAGITSNNTKWTDNNGNPGAQWGAHFGLDVIPVPRATLNLPAGIRLKPGFGVEYSERTLTYANAPNSWKKMSSNGFGASPLCPSAKAYDRYQTASMGPFPARGTIVAMADTTRQQRLLKPKSAFWMAGWCFC